MVWDSLSASGLIITNFASFISVKWLCTLLMILENVYRDTEVDTWL